MRFLHPNNPTNTHESIGGTTTPRILHSIEYDTPHPFAGQRVLCVGARASGADIAREISKHASRVYLSDSTHVDEAIVDETTNVVLVGRTTRLEGNRVVYTTNDGEDDCEVDVILLCSG